MKNNDWHEAYFDLVNKVECECVQQGDLVPIWDQFKAMSAELAKFKALAETLAEALEAAAYALHTVSESNPDCMGWEPPYPSTVSTVSVEAKAATKPAPRSWGRLWPLCEGGFVNAGIQKLGAWPTRSKPSSEGAMLNETELLAIAAIICAAPADIPGLWNAPGYPELTTAQMVQVARQTEEARATQFGGRD